MRKEIDYSFGAWSVTVSEVDLDDEILSLSIVHAEDGCTMVEASYKDIEELAKALTKDWT